MPHRTYLDPYRRSHARHGPAFEVTLWASRQSQELRFRVFSEMCFLAGKRILDAGCSRGDLAVWLHQHHIAFARYIGLDALGEVIEFARQRADLAGLPVEFHVTDPLAEPAALGTHRPQIIAVSGTLNTMTQEHAVEFLGHCWAHASEALIFNFLSDRCGPLAPPQADPARRLPLMKLLDWALTRTSQIVLRQDYFPHGHDATILMRKA